MWRFLAGAGAALLLMAAGALLYASQARPERAQTAQLIPPAPPTTPEQQATPLPATVPAASERTREEKRFDRYDKDRNGAITREEYLRLRRRAYARLDTNGDGRLSFEEWAVRTTDKFAKADGDKSGAMSRTEFATTAPKRRAPTRRNCPPQEAIPAATDEEG